MSSSHIFCIISSALISGVKVAWYMCKHGKPHDTRLWRLSYGFLRGLECLSRRFPLLWHLKHKPNFSYNHHRSLTVDSSRFHTMSEHVFLSSQTLHESSHVLSPEPLRFVLIWLGFPLFRILCITEATKGYHFDLTLGFSHSSRSLRSTYLGCSFNFCLLHLTTIFGGSFVTICCILVAGLKPAPWMFSQCCASCQIVFILICWYLQELIDQWLWN